MWLFGLLLWSICLNANGLDLNFPPGFKFGSSTSSYQIEGAWNVSDKGESVWDRFIHEHPEISADRSNGDVAADSYHQWQRDVEMTAELGLDFYRFSISWPRLLPTGYPDQISEDGKMYYSNLIDGLLARGVEPVVTLHHWEMPITFHELGSWTNPLISNWFANYARVVFSLYGDRVKTWITINEPTALCDGIDETGFFDAVKLVSPNISAYVCNKNLLLAHAKAWRVYDEEFRPKYNGKLSISNHLVWFEEMSEEYADLAELARQFTAGRYSHAIYSEEGGWPSAIEQIISDYSIKQGYETSILPAFTDEEKELIQGTYDFFAINYYTSRLVRGANPGESIYPFFILGIPEIKAVMEIHPDWNAAQSENLVINPEGLRKKMAWVKKNYGDLEIVITENGYSSAGDMQDTDRIQFIYDHLEQVLLSIQEDKVNVTAYTYWSLLDAFEWVDGYEAKFGLYSVDFSSPERTRSPRASAEYYASVIRTSSLDVAIPQK